MKIYPVLKYLTDVEVERLLAHEYRPQVRQCPCELCQKYIRLRDDEGYCPLGRAFDLHTQLGNPEYAPTPGHIAAVIQDRNEGLDWETLLTEVYVFTRAVDTDQLGGDLAAIVAASRA